MAPYLVTFFWRRHGGMAFLHTVFVRDGDLFSFLNSFNFLSVSIHCLGFF